MPLSVPVVRCCIRYPGGYLVTKGTKKVCIGSERGIKEGGYQREGSWGWGHSSGLSGGLDLYSKSIKRLTKPSSTELMPNLSSLTLVIPEI